MFLTLRLRFSDEHLHSNAGFVNEQNEVLSRWTEFTAQTNGIET